MDPPLRPSVPACRSDSEPGPPGSRLSPAARAGLLAFLLAVIPGCGGDGATPPYDVVIQGGTVVDGTGAEGFEADVAVGGDRVVRVARDGLPADSARELLDARGLVVAPGFVDHGTRLSPEIRDRPLLENFLRQGITTVLASPRGGNGAWAPGSSVEGGELALNVGIFVDHARIRREVMGEGDRSPTNEELSEMEGLLAAGMREGALGLSVDPGRPPGAYAGTEELVSLARVAARHGGLYYTQLRNEGPRVVDAVAEAVAIGREAGIPVHIQKHRSLGPPQRGRTRETLALMDSARAEGVDVTHDIHPYAAAVVEADDLFPVWARAGGADSLEARLRDPEVREALEREMREAWLAQWTGDDLSRVQFGRIPGAPDYRGRTLADLARARGLPNDVETGVELAIELRLDGGFSAIVQGVDERDMIRTLQHPHVMLQTGGEVVGHGVGHPDPPSHGAFPRVFSRYVRQLGALNLEGAVHRMTGRSMERLGLGDRGTLEEGRYADVVVFDPAAMDDRATVAEPHRHSVGVVHTLVNGTPVLRDGSLTGRTPGRVLRRPLNW